MKCEKCNKEHKGNFGSGLFCSRSCANSRVFTKEARLKKSIAGKKYFQNNENCMKGIPRKPHTEQTKKLLSQIGKVNYKKGLILKLSGNSYPRKLELKYKPFIEKYFNTKDLKPEKIGKHWFDFVNENYIIEFTIDATAGIHDAIKRFKTVVEDKRKKFLVCPSNWFGQDRRNRLFLTGAIFVDINNVGSGVTV